MDPVLLVSCALIGVSVSMLVYMFLARSASPTLGTAPTTPLPGQPTLAPRAPRQPKPVEDVIAKNPTESTAQDSSNLHEVLLARSRSERVVKPWLNKINSFFAGATPKGRIEALHELAITAGVANTWTPQRIATARTISLISGIVLGLLSWRAMGGTIGIAFGVIVAGVGWRGFDVYMSNRARGRQELIMMELPDVADQVAISVQAGLSFEQAIRRTVDSTEGPLSEELARFLHDTRVGIPRQQSFRALQERVDVADVTSFVRAIAQAEKTGVSIAEILQIQADELREKRKQRAEERAMKLPVLMLLPLVSCILPPLLIVLLGPAIIQVMETGFGT